MASPTFLICGGQRCGTTALWHLLNEHPDVYMASPPVPEPKYFLSTGTASLAEYEERWFRDAERATAIGEKSTSYLEVPGTAKRIRAAYPQIRLIFIFRHPAERAVSNYFLSVKHGLEQRDFPAAIAQGHRTSQHPAVQQVSPFDYVKRGHYRSLLEQFLTEFPAEQQLYLFYDDLVSQPESICQSAYRFLNVDDSFRPPGLQQVRNAGSAWRDVMSRNVLKQLIGEFAESNAALAALTGRDLAHWNRPTVRLANCVL
ncbi:MAG: sulfotransferase [Fuerstiella sp.]